MIPGRVPLRFFFSGGRLAGGGFPIRGKCLVFLGVSGLRGVTHPGWDMRTPKISAPE